MYPIVDNTNRMGNEAFNASFALRAFLFLLEGVSRMKEGNI
jgi:hypothetical protein